MPSPGLFATVPPVVRSSILPGKSRDRRCRKGPTAGSGRNPVARLGQQHLASQGVRSLPANLEPERLRAALASGWDLGSGSLEYIPEGGGAYHWQLTGRNGQRHFVTVDDLDGKDWIGATRSAVFAGLGRALGT